MITVASSSTSSPTVGKRPGRHVGNDKESCPSGNRTTVSKIFFLHCDHDDILPEGTASMSSFAFPAHVRLVDFDLTGKFRKFLPSRTHHCLAELVKAEPCSGIGKTGQTLKTLCAAAVFPETDVPHDPEPCQEKRMRVLKGSS